MKALIITWEKFQDHEVIYPFYRLKEEKCDVRIMSNVIGKFHGILGTNMESDFTVDMLKQKSAYNKFLNEFDFLVIPGGVKALEKLRQEKQVLQFINDWNRLGKVISSTCHGAQLLISSKVVAGRKLSGYYSIKDDINNAGALYVDAPAVIDKNIISSPHYKWMGEWMHESIRVYNELQ
jgi:protease I